MPDNRTSYGTPSRRTVYVKRQQDEPLDAIQAAIANQSDRSHAFYFWGPGGIGKTRLLEEVAASEGVADEAPFLVTGIIDLYHAEYHSPGGLHRAIIDGLDLDNRYFQTYREQRRDFEQKRREGISADTLERARLQLDETFNREYTALAQDHRLVLCFDTLELVQHESDAVQNICQVDDVDTVTKNWLLEHLSRLPNSVILFAGRPRPQVQKEFEQRFLETGCAFTSYELSAFKEQETVQYLNTKAENNLELKEILQEEPNQQRYKQIHAITQGRPVYLALLIDLLLHGQATRVLPLVTDDNPSVDEFWLSQKLVDHLRTSLPSSYNELMRWLRLARKGLNAKLLKHLVGETWPENEITELMTEAREFEIVKARQAEGQELQLFLHDEVYNMFDRHFRNDPGYAQDYRPIARFYRRQLQDESLSLSDREKITLAGLYYEMQVDPYMGYYCYYARWDHEAIKSHEMGYDMRLRDEVLRFLNRYTDPESPFLDPRIADRVDRSDIDRDCAVRWVRRHQARGEVTKARQVAEDLRYSKHPLFDWETINAPLYKADLLTAWGETMVQKAIPAEDVAAIVEEGIRLLSEVEMRKADDKCGTEARILGLAHNRLGYLYRTNGRYSIALRHYQRALTYFNRADIESERATTLNNLAFLLALHGRPREARRHIEQALAIRQKIGRRYPIALSLNTLGRIFTLEDHPMWGSRKSLDALQICEDLDEKRGIGLACNALGFSLRKRGDQWKLHYEVGEAEAFFQEGQQYLQRAIQIFSTEIDEPIRLWEAYNELGSLYTDWGWLARHMKDGAEMALALYDNSIYYQNEALTVARKHRLVFQVADSYDDLAQVYGDRNTLLIELGRTKEAQESRKRATDALEKVKAFVPEEFQISPGRGFQAVPEPGEAYWLSMGKLHLWQGIWGFRDLQLGLVPDSERADRLKQATHGLILSVAYFQHYWPASYDLEHTLEYFSRFLQEENVLAEWAKQQVTEVVEEYQTNLDILHDLIDQILSL